jgi:ribonuclease D
MHAGLEPRRIDCTMLQANALTGRLPSLAAPVEAELDWKISKEQQVSDWGAPVLSQQQIEYAALDAVLVHRLFPILPRPENLWVIVLTAGAQLRSFAG